MQEHINLYGRIFQLEQINGAIKFAHERPFPGTVLGQKWLSS
jgi:hypothetical protein